MKIPVTHTLYFKLAIGLAAILLIVGLSYTLFASYMLQQINQSSQQLINRDLARNLVNDKKIVHDGKIDSKAMKQTFMQYMSINPSIEIYYVDLQGNIIAYSAEPGKVKRNSIDLKPVLNFLSNSRTTNIMGDDPRSHDSTKPFSVTPIPDTDNPQGYLYVVLQSEELTSALSRQSQNTVVFLGGTVLAGSLFIGLLMGLFIFYRIHKRIRTLQQNVEHFVSSDFSNDEIIHASQVKNNREDEINALEKHISHMSRQIRQQWSALKQQDSLRREMVANISHDLRTPLASIQGYLETLTVKNNQLTDAEKQFYLNTVIKQANGLQKLIDELFELAKLDAREHQPDMEKFPLLELIYDVIYKFEIRANKKGIQFQVNSEAANPMVYADLGLIERVLDNLINNALYYSPQDSTITLTIEAPARDSLTVKVSDTGCGIAQDQLQLVFERFHQAHTPERTDGHAGLGLCIVKKIIELHNQHIWVESKPMQGTEFNFTLSAI